MKKIISRSTGIFLIIIMCLSLSACVDTVTETPEDIWSEATYTSDAEFGEGDKTVFVKVVALDKTVTFTIHSDKKTLGDALIEYGLIEGEKGAYGLYVKKVNGIVADYNENQAYWGFSKDGESMMTGVDGAKFKDGEYYELVYTK